MAQFQNQYYQHRRGNVHSLRNVNNPQNVSVCRILAERYNVEARPGKQHLTCPFCGKETLSIKSDDTIAKCFHPACERSISPLAPPRAYAALYEVHDRFFQACRGRLRQEQTENGNAWGYLTIHRKIHPKVCMAAPMGVTPIDAETLINELFDEAVAKTNEVLAKAKKKGGQKKTPPAEQFALEHLDTARESLLNCCRKHPGWIVFAYANASHHIVAFRFRKPVTTGKYFMLYKPLSSLGVFGASVFSEPNKDASDKARSNTENLIVTEGEFNTLSIWTAAANYCDELEIPHILPHACSVGGSSSPDLTTLELLCQRPIVIIDPDDAGYEMAERIRAKLTVDRVEPPGEMDIDEWIKSRTGSPSQVWRELQRLLTQRFVLYRLYDGVAQQVYQTRQKQGPGDLRREFEICDQVKEIIIQDLLERGALHRTQTEIYYFSNETRRLMPVSTTAPPWQLLMSRYQINASERIFSHITSAVVAAALDLPESDVHIMSYYDEINQTLYVSNFAGQMYRIDGHKIKEIDNGADGILFRDPPQAKTFRFLPSEANKGETLRKHMIDCINFADDDETDLTVEQRRQLFTFWIYALFFETILRTKPICVFIGEKGSGKTLALRKLLSIVIGPDADVVVAPEKREDAEAILTNNRIVVFDNLDISEKWLENTLAVAATRSSVQRRQLFTTNTLVDYVIRCFVGVTCRTPRFRRDDVADRLLLFRVQRFDSFKSEAQMMAEFHAIRDVIWTELLFELHECVAALKAQTNYEPATDLRMADFARFALKIGRHYKIEDKLLATFRLLVTKQQEFATERDEPFIELLTEWIFQNQDEPDRWVTYTELRTQLMDVAKELGTELDIVRGGTRGFGQYMSRINTSLEGHKIKHKQRRGKGNKLLHLYEIMV